MFIRKEVVMDKKLTVSLSKDVIERAKEYARDHKTSLSKMIEAYFDSLTRENAETDEIEISPLVKSLSGVVDLPADYDYKKARTEHLKRKYA